MIGGYVLPARNLSVEEVFRNNSTVKLREFVIESENYVGWFFHTIDKHYSYSDDMHLLLVDGIPVAGNPEDGYHLFKPSKDIVESCDNVFYQFLDKIVSNVNIISVNRHQEELVVRLASPRASGGRIFYIQIPNKGLIICDDYRLLLNFSKFEIEPKAIYAILKFGGPPDPITIIKNIHSVPPSQYATCSTPSFKIEIQPYFKFDFSEVNGCNLKPTKDILQKSAQFLNSIDASILFSGGVDSPLFAHYLHSENNVDGFFLSFGENDPELTFAQAAASSAHINLYTFYMEPDDVVPAIKGAASSYMHPFSDFSTIPTYYLMNKIKSRHQEGGILIDGNGADICFGFGTLARHLLWRLLYAQPRFIKQVGRVLYDNAGMHRRQSKLVSLFAMLAKTCERDILLSPIVLSPIESFFTDQTRDCAQDVSSAFLKMFSLWTNTEAYNASFGPKASVGLLLRNTRTTCLKTFNVGKEHFTDVVYPYLWKDILVEQGKLSWNCKNRNGVLKWPLKKLLENYLPYEFIYREKRGFTPPLLTWLLRDEVHDFLCEILLNPGTFLSDFILTRKIEGLINSLFLHRTVSPQMLHFFWGMLFTELWLKENHSKFIINKVELE